jgi:hypothetical protein
MAFIALIGAGSIQAQGGKEASAIDQQGNVGVGTGAPQACQVGLPESAKLSAPRPGASFPKLTIVARAREELEENLRREREARQQACTGGWH